MHVEVCIWLKKKKQTHNCLTEVTGCHNFTTRVKFNKNRQIAEDFHMG